MSGTVRKTAVISLAAITYKYSLFKCDGSHGTHQAHLLGLEAVMSLCGGEGGRQVGLGELVYHPDSQCGQCGVRERMSTVLFSHLIVIIKQTITQPRAHRPSHLGRQLKRPQSYKQNVIYSVSSQ